MTTTNRGVNRVLLFLIGLIGIITGVTIGAGVLQPVRDALHRSSPCRNRSPSPTRRCGSSPESARWSSSWR